MVDGEEEDPNVKYWKTKYELLHEDYGRTKERTEQLESRLLEMVEETEKKESEKDEEMRKKNKELEEASRRIEQLEAACFRYKNQNKISAPTTSNGSEPTNNGNQSEEPPELIQKVRTVRTTSGESVSLNYKLANSFSDYYQLNPSSYRCPAIRESTRSSIDGITRSPEFQPGEHIICEYHQLPILAKGEGFIYGFRWKIGNEIHIV